MRRITPFLLAVFVALCGALIARADAPPESEEGPTRVAVPKALIHPDDGDSLWIDWPEGPEVVRVLGMDTPETAHLAHDLPYPQPFGDAADGFLRGCMAMTEKVELLRAKDKDPYGRTLAYVFLDGCNYSVLVVEARLAVESVSHFGDNGFPAEAAEVLAAAKAAGPVPFEPPHRFRSRMRKLSKWLRARGEYPVGHDDDAK